MNLEKVVFAFFILLAATLNGGFVYGDIDNPDHHSQWEFFCTGCEHHRRGAQVR